MVYRRASWWMVTEPSRASREAMTRAVEGFGGLEHAMELVATIGGVRFVNDSKATNVDATIKALESFEKGLWVILGGKDKDSFVSMREARDKTLSMPRLIIPSLQVNMRAGQMPPKDDQGKTFLKVPINEL